MKEFRRQHLGHPGFRIRDSDEQAVVTDEEPGALRSYPALGSSAVRGVSGLGLAENNRFFTYCPLLSTMVTWATMAAYAPCQDA